MNMRLFPLAVLLPLSVACTVDTVVDSEPLATEQRRADEVLGDDESTVDETNEEFAAACAAIPDRVMELDEYLVPGVETEPEFALSEELLDWKREYCEGLPHDPEWRACAVPGNPVVKVTPKECDELEVPYLQCLLREDVRSLVECEHIGWEKFDCRWGERAPSLLPETGCETDWRWGESSFSREYQGCNEVTFSYGYRCSAPDESCGISCDCLIDAVTDHSIQLESQVVGPDFERELWQACSFPVLLPYP